MKNLIKKYFAFANSLQDVALLFLRLTLAYGFYGPAMEKVKHFENIPTWFESLGIPFPLLNAYMAVATEVTGVILITLGLCTRIIAVPMIVIMIVAIATVHYKNGFACGHNGFEVPFYYMLMLITLIAFGAGKFSIDNFISKKLS